MKKENKLITLVIILSVAVVLLLGITVIQTYNFNSDVGDSTTPDQNQTETPTPSDTNTSTDEIIVTEVIDGDTVDVRFPDGSSERIRVYGIDSPERNTSSSGTHEYGVESSDQGIQCLDSSSQTSTQYAKQLLLNEPVSLEKPDGENRGDFGRLLRYITVTSSGQNFSEEMLENGHARVYDDQGSFDREPRYTELERGAKLSQRGLWNCATINSSSNIGIFEVRADAEGSDTEGNTEFVEIGNTGTQEIQLDGYTLSDENGPRYTFSDQTLESGETIQIHTCEAPDHTQNGIAIDYCSGIWNNNGDTVSVIDANGTTLLELSYE